MHSDYPVVATLYTESPFQSSLVPSRVCDQLLVDYQLINTPHAFAFEDTFVDWTAQMAG